MAAAAPSASEAGGEDEVVMRLPVTLGNSDARSLCLFQYPLRPRWRPYDLNKTREVRVRPKQRRVELSLDNEQGRECIDESSPSPLSHITLTSTAVPPKTSYAVGMLRQGGAGEGGAPSLHLVPLDATIQMRPSFADVRVLRVPTKPTAITTAPDARARAAGRSSRTSILPPGIPRARRTRRPTKELPTARLGAARSRRRDRWRRSSIRHSPSARWRPGARRTHSS